MVFKWRIHRCGCVTELSPNERVKHLGVVGERRNLELEEGQQRLRQNKIPDSCGAEEGSSHELRVTGFLDKMAVSHDHMFPPSLFRERVARTLSQLRYASAHRDGQHGRTSQYDAFIP